VNLPEAFELAIQLHRAARLAEAESLYRQILSQAPRHAEVLSLLAGILDDTDRPAEAATLYHRITTLLPDDADAYVGLGNALRQLGNLDAAIFAYSSAIAIRPDFAGAMNNLANALWDSGNLEEAIPLLRRAASTSNDPATASNLLFALHFDPTTTPLQLRAEHDLWNERYGRPLFTPTTFADPPDPVRRLRIGYVSPDLHNHPVGLFMLPLLAHHDRTHFEIACYSDAFPDALSRQLSSLTHLWRDTRPLSDTQLVQLIRDDRIDILVDLTLHSRGSRLLAFARKPAPVQVTYLGYPSTTGLDVMDYRLSDPYLDPPGCDTGIYSETTCRLPATYWCYKPLFDVPPPGPPPAISNGFVTFGCLNNFYKLRPPVIDAWTKLLFNFPTSRLIVHARPGTHCRRMLDRFKDGGVDPQRIEFVDAQPLAAYFNTYRRIDIALDSFPFPGATTTLDALWSGVPVVTLAGSSAVSRAGASILSNIALTDLIAHDTDHYTDIARSLAADLPRLSDLRATLRQKMRSSPLTDVPRFARDIEHAFRDMWQR
jgi:predicted O-linked N-acetylglucosamine transferase (SPINDLY family)